MNLLLETIKRVLPDANKKAHDFDYAMRIARRERISIIIANYRSDVLGYYTTRRTKKRVRRFMMINANLNEIDRTYTAHHELGHHFLHAPISWRMPFYCRRNLEITKSKFDCEADAFALIAMIPQWLLEECSLMSFSELDQRLVPYLKRRWTLWKEHAI